MKSNSTILIVDDEEQNFDVIEILLFKEGYTLHFAQSASDALKFLEKNQVDTILLDVMMADVDGIELCHQIRANPQLCYIPIVMVTALNAKEDLAHCLEAGADDFISKPVSGVELRARVRSMLRIKHQYDALQESLQLREDMANMIVHDFSNHLVSIALGCDILRNDINQSRKDKQLQLMENSANQLVFLTDSLLMAAKLESGKMFLQLQEVQLGETIKLVLEDFHLLAKHRKIQLISDIPLANKLVYLDAKIIRRVLDNLVSNALKFSSANSQIKLCVEYPENLKVRIKVIDQGRGISDDLKLDIFKKYEVGQLAQGVSQMGLGLAFCKLAVEAHQGKIFIQDNQPQGTIFTIEI
jgi:two-component system, sensor histidine kinase and response regulator